MQLLDVVAPRNPRAQERFPLLISQSLISRLRQGLPGTLFIPPPIVQDSVGSFFYSSFPFRCNTVHLFEGETDQSTISIHYPDFAGTNTHGLPASLCAALLVTVPPSSPSYRGAERMNVSLYCDVENLVEWQYQKGSIIQLRIQLCQVPGVSSGPCFL